ncbi:hypothetical protein [Shouchella patagoniensis]|uniref:hypothetical protein n=1 Tax=Shouchella patagoniensis TaxID=228576 RepID=UPI0009958B31|nr:hypothetical protein [Shouchella patagoniensis]
MIQFQFSNNHEIENYIGQMIEWLSRDLDLSHEDVLHFFEEHKSQVTGLFSPYPETIFHDDPAKWAEILATSWGLIQEREIEFV